MRTEMNHHASVTAGLTFYGLADPALQLDNIRVDVMARQITVDGQDVYLTRTEFDLLQLFIAHRRRALSHAQILNHVWGESCYSDYHLIAVHVSNLRRKIGDGRRARPLIRTIHGYGYRFDC